jgi:hypothetical protein
MAKLYNSKTSRVSGTTDHAPLTSYMHHFISGTKIPHSLLNAQQITSSLHMPIKHYITSFGVFFVLYLFQRESFFLVFHHPFFFLLSPFIFYIMSLSFMFYIASCILFFLSIYFMDMFLVGVDQDPTRQPMTMDWQT